MQQSFQCLHKATVAAPNPLSLILAPLLLQHQPLRQLLHHHLKALRPIHYTLRVAVDLETVEEESLMPEEPMPHQATDPAVVLAVDQGHYHSDLHHPDLVEGHHSHQEEELHLRQFLQEEEEAAVHHHPVDTEDHHPLVAVAEEDHLLHPHQLIRATVTPRPLP